jgi:TPR repeat protein
MFTLKRTVAAVLLMLSFAASLAAAPVEDGTAGYNEGVVAYNRGDYATALKHFRPLADKGVAAAQNNIGVLYENGQGVPQNYAEAAKWYRLAADQGSAVAQFNLGLLYAKGQGVSQDYVFAHMWFNLSATQGNQAAKMDRDKAARFMSMAQIVKAQRLASEWKPITQPLR